MTPLTYFGGTEEFKSASTSYKKVRASCSNEKCGISFKLRAESKVDMKGLMEMFKKLKVNQ